MKRFPRSIVAGLLVVTFLAIALGPLAGASMHTAFIAHAITGECTGDCDTCGCSKERRESRTCCCWYNMRQHHASETRPVAVCCKRHTSGQAPVLSSACPCGKGRHLALWGKEGLQILPFFFHGEIPLPREARLSHATILLPVDRDEKPPVPPPELPSLS